MISTGVIFIIVFVLGIIIGATAKTLFYLIIDAIRYSKWDEDDEEEYFQHLCDIMEDARRW